MSKILRAAIGAVVFTLAAGAASAQSNLPEWPANWWNDLEAGASASYELNAAGMAMSLTQSIQSVEGSQITVSTAMSVMGNAMPATTQVIDAATLTTEDQLAMLQQMGSGMPGGMPGGMPNGPTPAQIEDIEEMITRVGETTCDLGAQSVDCTEYELTGDGVVSRAWIATSIPPVFMNGVVRSETTVQGQVIGINLTSYSGDLLD